MRADPRRTGLARTARRRSVWTGARPFGTSATPWSLPPPPPPTHTVILITLAPRLSACLQRCKRGAAGRQVRRGRAAAGGGRLPHAAPDHRPHAVCRRHRHRLRVGHQRLHGHAGGAVAASSPPSPNPPTHSHYTRASGRAPTWCGRRQVSAFLPPQHSAAQEICPCTAAFTDPQVCRASHPSALTAVLTGGGV
jgi:hypothetical protein